MRSLERFKPTAAVLILYPKLLLGQASFQKSDDTICVGPRNVQEGAAEKWVMQTRSMSPKSRPCPLPSVQWGQKMLTYREPNNSLTGSKNLKMSVLNARAAPRLIARRGSTRRPLSLPPNFQTESWPCESDCSHLFGSSKLSLALAISFSQQIQFSPPEKMLIHHIAHARRNDANQAH
jgi:hypothetical protein